MSGPNDRYESTTEAWKAGYTAAMERASARLDRADAERDDAREEAQRWAARMKALEARIDRALTALEGGET